MLPRLLLRGRNFVSACLIRLDVRFWHKSRHAQCADECPLLGAKRTLTNRCLPISIYEYTAQ